MPTSFYWITQEASGRLGIAPRPRGGDWLQDDLEALHRAGVNVLVSLLTPAEQQELHLQKEAALCVTCGMEFLAFPIIDRQVPTDEVATVAFAQILVERLAQQQNVLIHCRMGVGRAAMMAATILFLRGLSVESAFAQIASVRGCSVPDTAEQRQWVERLATRRKHAGALLSFLPQ